MKTLWIYGIFLVAVTCFAQQKVACVGNSITYGSGIGDRINDAYPGQLQKLLGADYVVQNCGNSGKTMLKHGDFPLWVEPEFKAAIEMIPDIVIILLGTNDTKPQNWDDFKDEFIPDYIAMIDTFRTINPNTQIYACLPPPAFSVQWGIRDSIITTDMIPMLHKIADSTGVGIVNFYDPFIAKNDLFPDDIHPDALGSWEMAKVVYTELTGKTVSYMNDVNLAAGKAVTCNGVNECTGAELLVDGDPSTWWSCVGGGSAVVDLGSVESIDLLQTNFGVECQELGQYYTIEISTDSENWTTVVDKSAVGDSSVIIAVDKIEAVDAQYVKLTPLGPVNGEAIANGAYEFKVLKTAPIHAPVIYIDNIDPRSRFTRYAYHIVPCHPEGYIKGVRSSDLDNPFSDIKGYRLVEQLNSNGSIQQEKVHRFYTMAYYDGIEIFSADTLVIDWSISAVQETNITTPQDFVLEQNYPNPFNPSTQIRYYLSQPSRAVVEIFNSRGQCVKTLMSNSSEGWQSINWDGKDTLGSISASGVYFYQLKIDGQLADSKKMLLLK